MKPESQEKWLAEVDTKIARREAIIEQTRHARNTSDSPMTSRYDTQRDLFNNDLNINLNALEEDKRFRQEIEKSKDTNIVESGAVVEVVFGEDDAEKVLFMDNYGILSDIQVVTPKSPLGQGIRGLKAGEIGSYMIKNENILVEIKTVE